MTTTYRTENASPSGRQGPHWGHPAAWAMHAYGPPLPLKLLSVGVGFLIFKPLGIALGAYWLLKGRFGFNPAAAGWGSGVRHCGPGSRGMGSSGNSAFDERRRETIMKLREEEKAFDDFAQEQRRKRDQEAFERFMAAKGAPQAPNEAPEGGH